MSRESPFHILVVHGPNLGLLGRREPMVYGKVSLEQINEVLNNYARDRGGVLRIFQSNAEGEIINRLIAEMDWLDGILINAGGYTHTSVAIRDTLAAIGKPAIEVHLSNIYAREPFRHISLLAPVCLGQISGLGWRSYLYGLMALLDILSERTDSP
ncbi:type II 3-dehydroquinate dehydratase [uncultured Thermanaerothrix sp.]|uniref:type II 3-dehydroquinate dehydratase n=1 Tax=uncultured Thermanaerothrix sp. TaxID=1195149 RepID=UPI00260234B3|nr:type II 3-dehydroquinate dehydratase [uncultured Thermanaerothrix sp.]